MAGYAQPYEQNHFEYPKSEYTRKYDRVVLSASPEFILGIRIATKEQSDVSGLAVFSAKA